jgi:hypothetical protein
MSEDRSAITGNPDTVNHLVPLLFQFPDLTKPLDQLSAIRISGCKAEVQQTLDPSELRVYRVPSNHETSDLGFVRVHEDDEDVPYQPLDVTESDGDAADIAELSVRESARRLTPSPSVRHRPVVCSRAELGRASQRGPHHRSPLLCPGNGRGEPRPVGSFRGFLYRLGRILGDVNAVKKGRIGRRVSRRIAGKATGRFLGRFLK